MDLLWWTQPYQTESTDHRQEMRRLPISPSPPPDPQLQPLPVKINKSTNQQLKSEQKHSTNIMFNVLNKMALFKHNKVVRYTRCNSLYCIWRKKKLNMNECYIGKKCFASGANHYNDEHYFNRIGARFSAAFVTIGNNPRPGLWCGSASKMAFLSAVIILICHCHRNSTAQWQKGHAAYQNIV